jgi:hypothetical protein
MGFVPYEIPPPFGGPSRHLAEKTRLKFPENSVGWPFMRAMIHFQTFLGNAGHARSSGGVTNRVF